MASSKTKAFEDLLKGLNGKLEASSAKIATAATTASTKHTAYVGTMDKFMTSVNEKLDAEKAEVSFAAKVAMEMHVSNVETDRALSSHQAGLDKVESTLNDSTTVNNEFTGHVDTKLTEVANYVNS